LKAGEAAFASKVWGDNPDDPASAFKILGLTGAFDDDDAGIWT
jgi:hypothetical protein